MRTKAGLHPALLLAALFSFAALVAAGPTAGVEPERSERPTMPEPPPTSSEDPAARDHARHEAWLRSDEARAQREASRDRYRDEDDAAAYDTASDHFADALRAPLWQLPKLRTGEDFAGYAGDWAMRVRRGDGHVSLMESTLPLRVEQARGEKAPVDLDLVERGGRHVPVNPIVDVRLPDTPEGAIELPRSGIAIHADVERGGHRAHRERGRLFWANVAADTDFFAHPTPTGVETSHVLRSPRSPERLRLRLGLPAGTELEPYSADALGSPFDVAHRVVRDGRVLAVVHRPVAVDAQQRRVPVTVVQQGDVLVLEVEHRGRDLAYPLLVDPVFDEWNWRDFRTTTADGWIWGQNRANNLVSYVENTANSAYGWGAGLWMYGYRNHAYLADTWGQWAYKARGNAFIYRADMGYVNHQPGGNSHVYRGISSGTDWERGQCQHPDGTDCTYISGSGGSYVPVDPRDDRYLPSRHYGWVRQNWETHCARDWCEWYGAPGNWAVFGLNVSGTQSIEPTTNMGVAHVFQFDWIAPLFYDAKVAHSGLPGGWTRSADITSHVYAQDDGLGMKRASIVFPGTGGAPVERFDAENRGCAGDRFSPCAGRMDEPIRYHSNEMPEGSNAVVARAYDWAGNRGETAPWTLKVDRTGPRIDVAGAPWSTGGDTVTAGAPLDVTATDPAPAGAEAGRPRSGVQSFELLVDGKSAWPAPGRQSHSKAETACPATSCSLSGRLDFDAADHLDGRRDIVVRAVDFAGNVTERQFDVVVDNRPPVVQAFAHPVRPTDWFSSAQPAAEVLAQDLGSGVKKAGFEVTGTWRSQGEQQPCAAPPNGARCPTRVDKTIAYNAADDRLPEGRLEARAYADDKVNAGTRRLRGLQADYWDTVALSGTRFSRVDSTVDWSWGNQPVDPRMPADNWSSRWTGYVEPTETGAHTFVTTTDDGARLWVDNVALVNDWNDHGDTTRSGTINLTAGRRYAIKMEHYDRSGGATARLAWQRPGRTTSEPIAPERLSPPDQGLLMEMFAAPNLGEGQNLDDVGRAVRVDPGIDEDWGANPADRHLPGDKFSIRWTGRVIPAYSERYDFIASADDGIMVWVDGRLLIDKWIDQAATNVHRGSIDLIAGREYDIRVAYYENAGAASAKLEWESPSQPRQLIPQNRLRPAHGTSASWPLKVDHSPPTIELSGPLRTLSGTTPLPAGGHDLVIKATDGDAATAATARSGVYEVDVVIDGDVVDSANQECPNGSCSLTHTYTFHTDAYSGGEHSVQVVARDQVGHRAESEPFTVTTACCLRQAGSWGAFPNQDTVFGDANGDGLNDVITRDRMSGTLRVGLSDGATFGPRNEWGTLALTYALRAGDVDGDGDDDVVGHGAPGGGSTEIVAGLSNGTSAFSAATRWTTWPTGRDLHLADVDGDAADDLVGRDQADGRVWAAYSDGGAFEEPFLWATWPATRELHVADVNGDEAADLVGRDSSSGQVRVAESEMSGFAPEADWGVSADADDELTLADVNGDGSADALLRDRTTGRVVAQYSDSSRFRAAVDLGAWDPAWSLGAADVDGDNGADLIGVNALVGDVRVAVSAAAPLPAPASDDLDDDVPDTDIQPRSHDDCRCMRIGFQDDRRLHHRAELFLERAPGDPNGRPFAGEPDHALAQQRLNTIYDRFEEAGGTVVRFLAVQGHIENRPASAGDTPDPDGNGQYERYYWDKLDQAIALARERDLEVLVTIMAVADSWDCDGRYNPFGVSCTPGRLGTTDPNRRVATQEGDCRPDDDFTVPPYLRHGGGCPSATGITPDVASFSAFARAVAQRYNGGRADAQVHTFAIYNEPNHRSFLRGTPAEERSRIVPFERYRDIYDGAYPAIREATRTPEGAQGAHVLIGELTASFRSHRIAPDGRPRRRITTMDFLAEAARPRNGVGLRADGVAVHPYQHTVRPGRRRHRSYAGIGNLGGSTVTNPRTGVTNRYGVQEPLEDLDASDWLRRARGTGPVPLYITEFGYFNRPPTPKTKWGYWHTERKRERWFLGTSERGTERGALTKARHARARWTLLYHGVEVPPDGAALEYYPDYGLFGHDGEYYTRRGYGRLERPRGQQRRQFRFAQDRRAYCGIWQWVRTHPASYRRAAGNRCVRLHRTP